MWSRRLWLVALLLVCAVAGASARGHHLVMLDAGHGGHDPGALGETAREKDINLAVARRAGAMIEGSLKGVKVAYTRDDDSFVPLYDRCRKANDQGADIFISIHCDSSEANPDAYGSTVYIGQDKLMVDTSAPADSAGRYRRVSRPDTPALTAESERLGRLIDGEMVATAGRTSRGVRARDFLVVQYTAMPAVLLELDYVCNPLCESYLLSDDGQEQLARAICNAVGAYFKVTPSRKAKGRKDRKGSSGSDTASTQAAVPETPPARNSAPAKAAQTVASGTVYKVQFATSPRRLEPGSPQLKGLDDADYYLDGDTYKYTVGAYTSLSQAKKRQAQVRELFPDAFIITVTDGKRVK